MCSDTIEWKCFFRNHSQSQLKQRIYELCARQSSAGDIPICSALSMHCPDIRALNNCVDSLSLHLFRLPSLLSHPLYKLLSISPSISPLFISPLYLPSLSLPPPPPAIYDYECRYTTNIRISHTLYLRIESAREQTYRRKNERNKEVNKLWIYWMKK